MATPITWTFASVLIVSALSLIGALALTSRTLNRHGVLMALVALAAGTLLGDTFFHILPEAAAEHGFTAKAAAILLAGFVAMFLFEVALRRQHAHVEHADIGHAEQHGHADLESVQPFGWLNLVGDAVHNLLDGVIIAAAYLVDIPLGIATTVAVIAHEIPQELGDFAVLLRAGMAPARALALNLGSALIAVVGATLVLVLPIPVESLEAVALPLIAGAFLYIAAADLVPELHHHSRGKDAFIILTALLAGIIVMAALLGLEGALFPAEAGHDHP